ncbi:MAG TPA: C cytochrome precursor [Verrucomicrobiales bacterium]|nr:C cytochrome precursor [Verrucomicrobiales bacterium]
MRAEATIVLLVVGGVLGLLAFTLRNFRRRAVGLAVVAVALVSSAIWVWETRRHSRDRSSAQLAEKLPHMGRPGGYVSSDQCQSCHPSQYASWHDSYHRTMTQVASPATVLGDFNNVTLEVDGEKFVLQQRGTEYWVEMVDPDWQHDQAKARAGWPGYTLADPRKAPRIWKRIGMLTGAHHFQAYWVPSMFGNMQFAFPFAWLIPERRWVPRKDTFIRDPEARSPIQNWNVNCIKCHATGGQPGHDPKTRIMHTSVGELGIACEACHGPAQQHVLANHNPLQRYLAHRDGRADPSIVNPKRLSPVASTQVCGQCHGMNWVRDPDQWSQTGFPYRPGDDLEATTPLIRPARFDHQPWLPEELKRDQSFLEGAFWPDGRIRVTGREYNGLIETACHTRGNLTCLSCHSIHQSDPDDHLAVGMEGNQACLQCHEKIGRNLESHTHHAPVSTGSQCYNCHMPYATYGLLKAVRNHYIDSPSVKTTVEAGRPNACNLCHLDQSLAWSARHLTDWYGAPSARLATEDQTTSSAVLLLLRGNAAQRALIAAALGWKPARGASGEQWMGYYLIELLDDPYAAVRQIAYRSLRTLPGYSDYRFDYVAPKADRDRAREQALTIWSSTKVDNARDTVLLDPDGKIQRERFRQFKSQRDEHRMDLIE